MKIVYPVDSKKSFRARVGSMDADINYQYVVVETEEDQNLDDPFSFRQGEMLDVPCSVTGDYTKWSACLPVVQ